MHGGFHQLAGRKKKPGEFPVAAGTFSDLGQPAISIREVERRIRRACKTLHALPDPDSKFRWIGSAWPEVVQSSADAYGYTEETMPRFRPTPADVSDYLVALSWARGIPWSEFRLVWWRSFDISFRHIGLRIHRSDETARNRYHDVIARIWYEADNQSARN